MDREIKFRAWYEDAKRYSKSFGLSSNVLNYTDDDGFGIIKSITTEIIEQYTGLKDKNGKYIYEGDVIKWGHLSGSYEDPIRIAVVEISPDIQFRLINGKHTFHFGNFAYQKTERALEVIGNIHENPELCNRS